MMATGIVRQAMHVQPKTWRLKQAQIKPISFPILLITGSGISSKAQVEESG